MSGSRAKKLRKEAAKQHPEGSRLTVISRPEDASTLLWNGARRAYQHAKLALRGSSGSLSAPIPARCDQWRRHSWNLQGVCVRCEAVKNLTKRKHDAIPPC